MITQKFYPSRKTHYGFIPKCFKSVGVVYTVGQKARFKKAEGVIKAIIGFALWVGPIIKQLHGFGALL